MRNAPLAPRALLPRLPRAPPRRRCAPPWLRRRARFRRAPRRMRRTLPPRRRSQWLQPPQRGCARAWAMWTARPRWRRETAARPEAERRRLAAVRLRGSVEAHPRRCHRAEWAREAARTAAPATGAARPGPAARPVRPVVRRALAPPLTPLQLRPLLRSRLRPTRHRTRLARPRARQPPAQRRNAAALRVSASGDTHYKVHSLGRSEAGFWV